MATVAITGNTYPVKEQLKALGGRWNGDQKAWMVPADKADTARKLVSGAPRAAYKAPYGAYAKRNNNSGGRWTGCSCGSIEDRPRDSDCASCQHDY